MESVSIACRSLIIHGAAEGTLLDPNPKACSNRLSELKLSNNSGSHPCSLPYYLTDLPHPPLTTGTQLLHQHCLDVTNQSHLGYLRAIPRSSPLRNNAWCETFATTSLAQSQHNLRKTSQPRPTAIMAEEYDPLASPKYSVASSDDGDMQMEINTGDYSNQGAATWAQNAADEDDDEDYDPSTFNFGETVDQSVTAEADPNQPQANATSAAASANPSRTPSRTTSAAPSASAVRAPPRTIAGFVQDDSDEEEDDDTHTPQPSQQANGTETSESGLGAVAVSESKEQMQGDVPIHSEAQDTAAVPSTSSTSLNGSTATNILPAVASMSDVASATPVTAPAQASPPATIEESSKDEGKVTSSIQAPISTTPTPQPNAQAPSVPATQTNGMVAPAASTARLPHDKIGQLEDRIKDAPQVDVDAWFSLIEHYKEKSKINEARSVFQRMIKVFPSSVCITRQSLSQYLHES